MTITQLKSLISDRVSPYKVQTISSGGKKISSTKDAYRDLPLIGYFGEGVLSGGEEFSWSFSHNGSDWIFGFEIV